MTRETYADDIGITPGSVNTILEEYFGPKTR